MTALGQFGLEAHLKSVRSSVLTVADDIAQGFFEITHNSFALLGLAVVFAVITLTARPDLRQAGEFKLMTWLQQRQEARTEPAQLLALHLSEPTAVSRATAADPKELTRQQAAVALWISRRYRVAPEPISRLVKEAWQVGQRAENVVVGAPTGIMDQSASLLGERDAAVFLDCRSLDFEVVPLGLAAGNGAGFPATFVVSTVILLFFAVGFTALTPYVEDAGAFFSYVRTALGFPAGIGIAFVALVSYVAIEAGVYGLLGPAGGAIVETFGGPAVPWWVYAAVAFVVTTYVGYRNIELSSKVLAILLTAEIAIVVVLGTRGDCPLERCRRVLHTAVRVQQGGFLRQRQSVGQDRGGDADGGLHGTAGSSYGFPN